VAVEKLSDFERAVLEAGTSGHDPIFAALRDQLEGLRAVSREFTGHGFFTELAVRPGAQPVPGAQDLAIGDLTADLEGLSHGGGFVLFVKQGLLATLEGFAYDEPWPDQPRILRLAYVDRSGVAETPFPGRRLGHDP
jgi:hypothetical protein